MSALQSDCDHRVRRRVLDQWESFHFTTAKYDVLKKAHGFFYKKMLNIDLAVKDSSLAYSCSSNTRM